jgi:hypothetical protein
MSDKARAKLTSAWLFLTTRQAARTGLGVAGRSTVVLTGCCSMVLGIALTFTLCGAVIGIPLFAFGFLLVARGLF